MATSSLAELANAVIELKLEDAERLTREAVKHGIPATEIVLKGLSVGMREVGRKFEERTYFLAELLMAAFIMNRCTDLLKPLLEKEVEKTPAPAKIVIGTVQGDLHDIGKNIVIALLRAAGFEVYDVGVDASASKFVQAVRDTSADVVGLSALLASTAPYFKDVIAALEEAGLRRRVYVMIGGPHATEAFAKEVGADVSCKDAVAGVDRAREYAERKRTNVAR
jgi:methylmalonyl-CoA mutase cobalamin-binding domain/chain